MSDEMYMFAVPIVNQNKAVEHIKSEILKVNGKSKFIVEKDIVPPKSGLAKLREDLQIRHDECILVCTVRWTESKKRKYSPREASKLIQSKLDDLDKPVKIRLILAGKPT